jgi:endonuclease/exonuclease/phosphatase family metal-dependent hydrolase
MIKILSTFSCLLILLVFIGCDAKKSADKSETEPAIENAPSQSSSTPETANPSESSAPSTLVPVAKNTVNEKNPAAGTLKSSPKFSNEDSKSDSNESLIPLSLKFLSWNVESEGSDPAVIQQQLAEFTGYDVIALTEVLPEAARDFGNAWGENYDFIVSRSGNNDRMMLIYNKESLSLVRKFEIRDINFKDRYRSPLVAHFKDSRSGKELQVMVNHLARGKAEIRQMQARKLVEWAREQTLPIVAVGDYNFDYVFADRNGNEGFRVFMKDNIWKWIEPIELVDTNWYDNPREPDGKDDYPGSMLDFGFVAGSAKQWRSSCKVIVRDGDFPDDETTSDHRPFELILSSQ